MLRISDIKLGTDDTESDLRKKVLKLLGVKNVKSFEISKKSIDARKKPDIHYVYSVDVETDNEEYYAKKIKNSQILNKKKWAKTEENVNNITKIIKNFKINQ